MILICHCHSSLAPKSIDWNHQSPGHLGLLRQRLTLEPGEPVVEKKAQQLKDDEEAHGLKETYGRHTLPYTIHIHQWLCNGLNLKATYQWFWFNDTNCNWMNVIMTNDTWSWMIDWYHDIMISHYHTLPHRHIPLSDHQCHCQSIGRYMNYSVTQSSQITHLNQSANISINNKQLTTKQLCNILQST